MYYEIDSSENFIEKLNRNNHKSTLIKLLLSLTLACILFYIIKPMRCYKLYISKDEITGETNPQSELNLYKMLAAILVITLIIYYLLTRC